MAEHAPPRRSRRIAAGVLIAVGAVAVLLGIFLLVSHVPGNADCGTILSPHEPPPSDPHYLTAGCGGARGVQTALVVLCGLVAAACIVVGFVMLQRDRRARSLPQGTVAE